MIDLNEAINILQSKLTSKEISKATYNKYVEVLKYYNMQDPNNIPPEKRNTYFNMYVLALKKLNLDYMHLLNKNLIRQINAKRKEDVVIIPEYTKLLQEITNINAGYSTNKVKAKHLLILVALNGLRVNTLTSLPLHTEEFTVKDLSGYLCINYIKRNKVFYFVPITFKDDLPYTNTHVVYYLKICRQILDKYNIPKNYYHGIFRHALIQYNYTRFAEDEFYKYDMLLGHKVNGVVRHYMQSDSFKLQLAKEFFTKHLTDNAVYNFIKPHCRL